MSRKTSRGPTGLSNSSGGETASAITLREPSGQAPAYHGTVSAWRPGLPMCSSPGLRPVQWLPCMTRDPESGGPHCWFMQESDDGLLHCFVCRDRRPYPVYLVSGKPREIDRERWHAYCAATGVEAVTPPPAVVPAPVPATRWRDRGDFLEFVTERAAIFEYLGGFARAVADRMAQQLADANTMADA